MRRVPGHVKQGDRTRPGKGGVCRSNLGPPADVEAHALSCHQANHAPPPPLRHTRRLARGRVSPIRAGAHVNSNERGAAGRAAAPSRSSCDRWRAAAVHGPHTAYARERRDRRQRRRGARQSVALERRRWAHAVRLRCSGFAIDDLPGCLGEQTTRSHCGASLRRSRRHRPRYTGELVPALLENPGQRIHGAASRHCAATALAHRGRDEWCRGDLPPRRRHSDTASHDVPFPMSCERWSSLRRT